MYTHALNVPTQSHFQGIELLFVPWTYKMTLRRSPNLQNLHFSIPRVRLSQEKKHHSSWLTQEGKLDVCHLNCPVLCARNLLLPSEKSPDRDYNYFKVQATERLQETMVPITLLLHQGKKMVSVLPLVPPQPTHQIVAWLQLRPSKRMEYLLPLMLHQLTR